MKRVVHIHAYTYVHTMHAKAAKETPGSSGSAPDKYLWPCKGLVRSTCDIQIQPSAAVDFTYVWLRDVLGEEDFVAG